MRNAKVQCVLQPVAGESVGELGPNSGLILLNKEHFCVDAFMS